MNSNIEAKEEKEICIIFGNKLFFVRTQRKNHQNKAFELLNRRGMIMANKLLKLRKILQIGLDTGEAGGRENSAGRRDDLSRCTLRVHTWLVAAFAG